MDAADHLAMGEQALVDSAEALDAREANEFVALATAHFTGGLLAWALSGQVDGAEASIEQVTARHPFATVALFQAVKQKPAPGGGTRRGPDTKTTHEGVDA